MRKGKRERIALREQKRLKDLQKKYKASIQGNSRGYAFPKFDHFNPIPTARKWGYNAKGRRISKVVSIAVWLNT